MNLFGSEDRTCCSVDVHAISCAVAIDLENHSHRSRKRRLRRLEPEIFSWLRVRWPTPVAALSVLSWKKGIALALAGVGSIVPKPTVTHPSLSRYM